VQNGILVVKKSLFFFQIRFVKGRKLRSEPVPNRKCKSEPEFNLKFYKLVPKIPNVEVVDLKKHLYILYIRVVSRPRF